MRPVRFRPLRADEAGIASALALRAKAHWGYPGEWLRLWRHDLTVTPEAIEAADTEGAFADGYELLGFLLRRRGIDARNRSEIEHLWVDPSVMGTGIGGELVRRGLGRARREGAPGVVVVSDPNAAGFYRRMGAVDDGEVPSVPAGRVLPRLLFLFWVS